MAGWPFRQLLHTFWAHDSPSPWYPALHAQVNEPSLLVHVAWASQLWLLPSPSHSSSSLHVTVENEPLVPQVAVVALPEKPVSHVTATVSPVLPVMEFAVALFELGTSVAPHGFGSHPCSSPFSV